MQILNCKMQNFVLKFGNSYHGGEIAKIDSKIYSEREGEDSQRNFGFKRTRKVDPRVISKIFERELWQK
jgi:hypothetical protein